MKKWIPWVLFCVTLLAAVYMFILLLNAGGSLGDARSQVDHLNTRSEFVLSILREDWVGKDEASVITLSSKLEQQGVIVGKENNLYEIGELIFVIHDGVVIDVHYF